jgi:hypothetical protein
MRKLLTLVVGICVLMSYSNLLAQEKTSDSGPPKRLQLVIEDVKPGKGAAHEKSEAVWLATFLQTNIPSYGIGMTSMTGRSEAWFVNIMGDSWADWDKWGKQMDSNKAVAAELAKAGAADGELINGQRTYYLDYDPDISYRPDFKLGEYRFFLVDTVRVRPGHGHEFAELRKAINAAHEKVNMDEHMLVYYAGMGGAGGTFFIFEPLKTIASMDEIEKLHGDGSEYRKALGEDFQKMNREFQQSGLMSIENDMFAISPKMSYVSEATVKLAPDFWLSKTALAKARPMTASAVPAAKKENK